MTQVKNNCICTSVQSFKKLLLMLLIRIEKFTWWAPRVSEPLVILHRGRWASLLYASHIVPAGAVTGGQATLRQTGILKRLLGSSTRSCCYKHL